MLFPGNTFLYLVVFIFLWLASITGAIAVLPSWIFVEPEREEGVLNRGGRSLEMSRWLLTAGSAVVWICTLLDHALSDSIHESVFSFWQHHPVLLVALLFLANLLFIASVVFALRGCGSQKWILRFATPAVAASSILASVVSLIGALHPPTSS